MNLTQKSVAVLQSNGRDTFVWDSRLPGFGVRVQPSGRKTYVVRYRTTAGTQRKMNIARCDVMHLDDARTCAREILALAAHGNDPARDRRDKRKSLTMNDLAQEYTAYKSNFIKSGTKANHKTNWNKNILPILGNMRVADISQSDIIDLHVNRGKLHPVNANRCIDLLKAAFNYAERRGWREKHTNPAKDIEKFPERGRQRILTPQEIARLFRILDTYAPDRGCWSAPYAIKLLALSGLRKTEWTKSRWEWLDFAAATLSLPDSKTGAKIVHLSSAVIDLLTVIRSKTESPWICPCSNAEKPLMGLGRHWAKVRALAGLKDVRLHDLRHTVGSLGHMAGLSQRQIADLLGHKSMATSARYIHTMDKLKTSAANTAANEILKHVTK